VARGASSRVAGLDTKGQGLDAPMGFLGVKPRKACIPRLNAC